MGERFRLGLVGPGDVAERDYLPEFDRIADRAEIAAVCGRREDRARTVGERLGVPWYIEVARMLEEVELDGVLNLTPIQRHASITREALEAGLHVYSEKPLAGSVAEAEALADLASRRGLALVAAPSVLRFPQVRYVADLLGEGAIGEIRTVRAVVTAGPPPWEGYASDPTPYFTEGGGPLVDLAVYPLHAITGLVGSVARVAASGLRSRDRFTVEEGPLAGTEVPVAVDDAWVLLLELAGGAIGTVEADYTTVGTRAPELELHGTRGTIALSLLDGSAPVEVVREDGTWTSHPVPDVARAAGGPDHLLGVAHLLDVAREGATNELSPAHAIHVLEVLEAAAEARDGSARRLRTTVGGRPA